jgi:hypothetical protein
LISIDQTLHLIIIFCTTVNSQQCPILIPSTFLHELKEGAVTRYLCHSMCAAALPFSRHALNNDSSLGVAFAADARECLALSQPPNAHSKLQQLLSTTVLAAYESSQGNGLQAWSDLSKHSCLSNHHIQYMSLPSVARL